MPWLAPNMNALVMRERQVVKGAKRAVSVLPERSVLANPVNAAAVKVDVPSVAAAKKDAAAARAANALVKSAVALPVAARLVVAVKKAVDALLVANALAKSVVAHPVAVDRAVARSVAAAAVKVFAP